ncbi:MAG: beta-galactosidase, partial [Chloroflexota bacterium]|nr:beta-galactosidase [Chloroflexota bacterium]
DPDYVLPGARVDSEVPRMPLVQYGGSHRVRPRAGTEVLSQTVAPYFQRTWRHYSSHHQTPYDRPTGLPAATRKGPVIYVAAPVFAAYARQAYPISRQLLSSYLALLLPTPLVRASLPTAGQVTLLEQPDGRRVAHLLYYVWQRRAPDLDVLEDVVPLHDVDLVARTRQPSRRVYLAPQGQDLEFAVAAIPGTHDQTVSTRVPLVAGHQMVVFEP